MHFKQNRWYVVAAVLSLLIVSIGISGYLWSRTLVAPSKPSLTHVQKAHPTPVATATPPLNMATNVHLLIPENRRRRSSRACPCSGRWSIRHSHTQSMGRRRLVPNGPRSWSTWYVQ